MSTSNYDGRPDEDDLYYSGDEEQYSTVGVDQIHNDVPVSHDDENHVNVRASDSEVREIWIRRAKGRVSSTTTKFVRSYVLRGNTASSHAAVSYLPLKSNSIVPRKIDYMTVPDLAQFTKKDQNVQKDPSQFDFIAAELECNKEDELSTDPGESSTGGQKDKVPLPRSNLIREIRQIDKDQSESRVSSRTAAAPALVGQSELNAHGTSDQSAAAGAQLICYKSSCRRQFVRPALLKSGSLDATSRKILSNSIDFVKNCARPHRSSFLRRTTSNLLWLLQGSHHRSSLHQIPRKRTRPRKLLVHCIHVTCAAISLSSRRIIAVIWSSVMGSLGIALLRLLRILVLVGLVRRSSDVEPDSDD